MFWVRYHRAVNIPALPYTIATLCYLFDEQGHLLLLHRRKPPNRDLYSPIGGKLETTIGESPAQCAVREVLEETGLTIAPEAMHLTGVVSESGYEDAAHWLMFLYEVTHPVALEPCEFDEGRLEWHDPAEMAHLPMPVTDREHIWPLFWQHRGGFFAAHLECRGGTITRYLDQSMPVSVPEVGRS